MGTKKWIGDGLNSDLAHSTRNNVLNVVRALVEDHDSIVYIPDTYMNGSKYRSSADPAVHFLPSECGKAVRVIGVQSNQERYNFSLICLVDVAVEFNNDDGTVDIKNKKVFRQYNIIRDGELTVDYLAAKLSKDSFDALKKIGVLFYNGIRVAVNHNWNRDYVYKVALKSFPLVSYNWAQPIRIGLIDLMDRENMLSSKLKVMKAVRKTYSVPNINVESEIYNEKTGEYSVSDSYESKEVDCVVYSIKNLPEHVFSEDKIKSEYPGYFEIDSAISEINKDLRTVRFLIRAITFAIESTKQENYNWSEVAKVPRSKTKTFQQCDITDSDGKVYTLVRTMYKKTV